MARGAAATTTIAARSLATKKKPQAIVHNTVTVTGLSEVEFVELSRRLQISNTKQLTKLIDDLAKKQQAQIQAAITKLERGQKEILKKQEGTNTFLNSHFQAVLKLLKTLTGPKNLKAPAASE